MLRDLNALLEENGLEVVVRNDARQWLLQKAGVDPSCGARGLRRTLQRWIQDAISEMLIARPERRWGGSR